MPTVTDRYYPRIFIANVIMWGVGVVIFIGLIVFLLWSGSTYDHDVTGFVLAAVGAFALIFTAAGIAGFRRGEFTPTAVTVNETGIDLRTRPARHDFAFAWQDIEQLGMIRDAMNRPWAIVQAADRLERGLRTRDEIAILAFSHAPAHARAFRLTDTLQQALEARQGSPLQSYQATA